jgi:hypothetical protein
MNAKSLLTLAAAAALLSATGATVAAEDCDRNCLKQVADRYFDAMAAHSTAGLPLAAGARYTENGKQVKLGEGLWKTAGQATYRMDSFDPESGGIGIVAVVTENGQPTIMMLRLKVSGRQIGEAETIIVRKGEAGSLWAPEKLTAPSAHFTRTIRPAERNSRFELLAAADAYFRAFETEGTPEYVPAPFLPDTNRFENGVQTTNVSLGGRTPTTAAEQFDRALFKNARIYDRRYPVVDVEHGIVLGIVRFGRKLNPDGTEVPLERSTQAQGSPLVAEFFAINGGKIREILVVLISAPANSPTGW